MEVGGTKQENEMDALVRKVTKTKGGVDGAGRRQQTKARRAVRNNCELEPGTALLVISIQGQ